MLPVITSYTPSGLSPLMKTLEYWILGQALGFGQLQWLSECFCEKFVHFVMCADTWRLGSKYPHAEVWAHEYSDRVRIQS